MKKNLVLLSLPFLLPATPSSAQNALNWQALEVVDIETDDANENRNAPNDAARDLFEHGNRFGRLLSGLKAGMAERNRKVDALAPDEKVYSAIHDMVELSFPGGVKEMQRRQSKMEDELYDMIIHAPKFTYQYFAPLLHTLPYMPERILNIPGIKELKGKFPTRIAPQMKEYAKKYGKYMSPYLYVLLMPEAWPAPDREKPAPKSYSKIITIDENTTPADLFFINDKSLLDKYGMLPPDAYQSGGYATKTPRPQTPADQVTADSPVTEGDIEASLGAIGALKAEFGMDRLSDFHSELRRMALFENNLAEELVSPIQILTDRTERMPPKFRDKMRSALAKHGFTPRSFGLTMDKILKAHRVAKMTPSTALTLAAWRGLKRPPESFDVFSPEDKAEAWKSIRLFLEMYSTTEENLLAVKKYSDNIRETFGITDMTFMEAPIFGI